MAAKLLPYEPDYLTLPGEVLEEFLEARGMTKAELAVRCGRPMKTISEIIHGKAAITAETAIQLGRVLGMAPEVWQNLEANYRLALTKREESKQLQAAGPWAQRFPWKLLVERGALEAPRDEADLVKKLLAFFGVGTVAGWEASFGQMQVAYRRSPAFEAAPENVTSWIRLGEVRAAEIECQRYDKARFREVLDEARALTAKPFPDVQEELEALCASAGVAFALVPELPKTHMSGLARWLSKDKALIQLSLRYKTADYLWFSFFHEAGHVLLHGKKTIFIDENGGDRSELEEEANKFAGDLLIPPAAYKRFVAAGDFGRAAVSTFAKQQGIGAGIVVGRLQHEKRLPYSHLNELKEKLVWGE